VGVITGGCDSDPCSLEQPLNKTIDPIRNKITDPSSTVLIVVYLRLTDGTDRILMKNLIANIK